MGNKRTYLVLTPFFPSDEGHVGSYVYDQAKAIIKLSDYDVNVIKVVSFFFFRERLYF